MYSHALTSHLKKLKTDERGSAVLEFAASAVLLFTVVFGIMDTARALYVDNFVSNGAREAVRYAMVRGATWNGTSCATTTAAACAATAADVTAYLDSLAPAGIATSPSYLTVNTTWPGITPSGASCSSTGVTNAPGCAVEVKVTYSFNFIIPFLPKNALSLSSTSAMAISQ